MSAHARIVVIKLGAFGDLVQSLDALAALRARHAGQPLELLTTAPYRRLMEASGWFDTVRADGRPPAWRLDRWWRLRGALSAPGVARVYDLQCSPRTRRYFTMLPRARQPEWIGDAPGCSHPNPDFAGQSLSNRAKMAAQLDVAGIAAPRPAELGWLDAPIGRLGLPYDFALLVPSSSPAQPEKRWPASHYAALAGRLAARGLAVALAGTAADREVIDATRAAFPAAIDLSGRTSLMELAAVARRAAVVVGNDTGPVFLAGALGTPTLMLMSRWTDPAVSAPWGARTAWLRRARINDITVGEVAATLDALWGEEASAR